MSLSRSTSFPSPELQKVADYFISKSNEASKPITNKKLQKLVYYVQSWNLVFNGKKLFDEPVEAWIHGPAIRVLYNRYKKYVYYVITEQADTPKFDKKTQVILDEVWAVYGKYDADYLEVLSHNEQPWLSARENAEKHERTENIIDTEQMRSFYAGLLKSVKA